MTWDPPTDWGVGCPQDSYYYLYLKTPSTAWAYLDGTAATSYTTGGYVNGETYYWIVQSFNGSKYTQSPVRTFTINIYNPTAPANLSPSLTCENTVFRTYSWDAVAGAMGFG
jgi:hypothetical protein